MDKINICDLSRDIDKDSLLSKYASNGNLSIEFSYLSDFKSAKILRDIVGSICNHLKLDKITTSRITLIVDEMNNNAIEYGSQKGDMNKIRFQTESYGGNISMIIEVEDSGK
jgi:anti-sigma regulatory factor (Ser/Thr protein kinase)